MTPAAPRAATRTPEVALFGKSSQSPLSENVNTRKSSHSNLPACVTITNALENQYIMYCDAAQKVVTLSYTNLVTSGSTAGQPAAAAASTTIDTAISFVPQTGTDTSIIATSILFSTLEPASSSPPTASTQLTQSLASDPNAPQTIFVTSTFGSPNSPSALATQSSTTKSSSSSLSTGAIIGIAVSVSLASLFVALALLFLFCIRPFLARRRNRTNPQYLRGTLGGATLPGSTPLMNDTSPQTSEWKPNHDSVTATNSPELGNTNAASGQETSQPWTPNSFGLARSEGEGMGSPELDGLKQAPRSPELDGSAVTPEVSSDGARWGGAPTIRHGLGTQQKDNPEGEGLGAGAGGLGIPNSLVAGQKQQLESGFELGQGSVLSEADTNEKPLPQMPQVENRTSTGTGTGGNGFLSPVTPTTGSDAGMSPGMGSSLSGRGSWLSPEMAMAGGWRNDEEGN